MVFIILFLPFLLSALEIKMVTSREIVPYTELLAGLCNSFFSEAPYFYAGTDSDYAEYLNSYAESKNGVMALALDEGRPIGLALGIPMSETWSKYQQPFKEHGYDLSTLFYLGEIVLTPAYQNQGLENQLYLKIENYAKSLGSKTITYMSIELPQQSLKEIQSLNTPWIEQGFKRHEELAFDNFWTDIGHSEKTPHKMVFWLKPINEIIKNNSPKFAAIRTLNLPMGQYAITGSGTLGIRNLRAIGDIDIIVTPELWNALEKKYGVTDEDQVKKIVFPDGIVEAFGEHSFYTEKKDETTPTMSDRIAQAEVIEGLPFESLEHVLYYKRKMNRDKDKQDIKIIESLINQARP